MKKVLFSFLVLLATSLQAQTGFNYKAQVANNGSIATNQGLTVRFTVYNGNPTAGGVQVYQETQATTTDANGLISLILGTGTSSDNWNSISWSLKNQHLKTEFDLGSGYVDMGTQMFSAVPYAKYADYAGNAFSRLYDDLIDKPANFNIAGSSDYSTSIEDNVYRLGRLALGFNNPTEGKLDIRQSGTGTTNADLTGMYVKNSNTSTSALYGIKSDMPSNATGSQTAFYSTISGTGSGAHYGVYNVLTGAGTGVQAGQYSLIDNSGNQIHYGNYAALSGGGSGAHYGDYLSLSGAGTGSQIGVNVGISNSGNASHYGLKNNLSGTGSGAHYGVDNTLTGAGIGIQYAIKNTIDNSNTNTHYGVYNALSGTGSGTHYGNYNLLSGAGTGDQFGLRSSISNTGNGVHYALYADLSGSGSSTHLGLYNTLSGSGSGNQYGVKTEISNTSNGSHYGSYALLDGNGVGTKYGTYNKIESTAGGTHYAVYGNATKAGSYAGYFVGDVKVSEKVLSEDSGDADMKAYIYGRVYGTSSGANIVQSASTDGFTVVRSAEGEYTITFDNSMANSAAYIVLVNYDRVDGANQYIADGHHTASSFKVFTEIDSGLGGRVGRDFNFSFVVYKK